MSLTAEEVNSLLAAKAGSYKEEKEEDKPWYEDVADFATKTIPDFFGSIVDFGKQKFGEYLTTAESDQIGYNTDVNLASQLMNEYEQLQSQPITFQTIDRLKQLDNQLKSISQSQDNYNRTEMFDALKKYQKYIPEQKEENKKPNLKATIEKYYDTSFRADVFNNVENKTNTLLNQETGEKIEVSSQVVANEVLNSIRDTLTPHVQFVATMEEMDAKGIELSDSDKAQLNFAKANIESLREFAIDMTNNIEKLGDQASVAKYTKEYFESSNKPNPFAVGKNMLGLTINEETYYEDHLLKSEIERITNNKWWFKDLPTVAWNSINRALSNVESLEDFAGSVVSNTVKDISREDRQAVGDNIQMTAIYKKLTNSYSFAQDFTDRFIDKGVNVVGTLREMPKVIAKAGRVVDFGGDMIKGLKNAKNLSPQEIYNAMNKVDNITEVSKKVGTFILNEAVESIIAEAYLGGRFLGNYTQDDLAMDIASTAIFGGIGALLSAKQLKSLAHMSRIELAKEAGKRTFGIPDYKWSTMSEYDKAHIGYAYLGILDPSKANGAFKELINKAKVFANDASKQVEDFLAKSETRKQKLVQFTKTDAGKQFKNLVSEEGEIKDGKDLIDLEIAYNESNNSKPNMEDVIEDNNEAAAIRKYGKNVIEKITPENAEVVYSKLSPVEKVQYEVINKGEPETSPEDLGEKLEKLYSFLSELSEISKSLSEDSPKKNNWDDNLESFNHVTPYLIEMWDYQKVVEYAKSLNILGPEANGERFFNHVKELDISPLEKRRIIRGSNALKRTDNITFHFEEGVIDIRSPHELKFFWGNEGKVVHTKGGKELSYKVTYGDDLYTISLGDGKDIAVVIEGRYTEEPKVIKSIGINDYTFSLLRKERAPKGKIKRNDAPVKTHDLGQKYLEFSPVIPEELLKKIKDHINYENISRKDKETMTFQINGLFNDYIEETGSIFLDMDAVKGNYVYTNIIKQIFDRDYPMYLNGDLKTINDYNHELIGVVEIPISDSAFNNARRHELYNEYLGKYDASIKEVKEYFGDIPRSPSHAEVLLNNKADAELTDDYNIPIPPRLQNRMAINEVKDLGEISKSGTIEKAMEHVDKEVMVDAETDVAEVKEVLESGVVSDSQGPLFTIQKELNVKIDKLPRLVNKKLFQSLTNHNTIVPEKYQKIYGNNRLLAWFGLLLDGLYRSPAEGTIKPVKDLGYQTFIDMQEEAKKIYSGMPLVYANELFRKSGSVKDQRRLFIPKSNRPLIDYSKTGGDWFSDTLKGLATKPSPHQKYRLIQMLSQYNLPSDIFDHNLADLLFMQRMLSTNRVYVLGDDGVIIPKKIHALNHDSLFNYVPKDALDALEMTRKRVALGESLIDIVDGRFYFIKDSEHIKSFSDKLDLGTNDPVNFYASIFPGSKNEFNRWVKPETLSEFHKAFLKGKDGVEDLVKYSRQIFIDSGGKIGVYKNSYTPYLYRIPSAEGLKNNKYYTPGELSDIAKQIYTLSGVHKVIGFDKNRSVFFYEDEGKGFYLGRTSDSKDVRRPYKRGKYVADTNVTPVYRKDRDFSIYPNMGFHNGKNKHNPRFQLKDNPYLRELTAEYNMLGTGVNFGTRPASSLFLNKDEIQKAFGRILNGVSSHDGKTVHGDKIEIDGVGYSYDDYYYLIINSMVKLGFLPDAGKTKVEDPATGEISYEAKRGNHGFNVMNDIISDLVSDLINRYKMSGSKLQFDGVPEYISEFKMVYSTLLAIDFGLPIPSSKLIHEILGDNLFNKEMPLSRNQAFNRLSGYITQKFGYLRTDGFAILPPERLRGPYSLQNVNEGLDRKINIEQLRSIDDKDIKEFKKTKRVNDVYMNPEYYKNNVVSLLSNVVLDNKILTDDNFKKLSQIQRKSILKNIEKLRNIYTSYHQPINAMPFFLKRDFPGFKYVEVGKEMFVASKEDVVTFQEALGEIAQVKGYEPLGELVYTKGSGGSLSYGQYIQELDELYRSSPMVIHDNMYSMDEFIEYRKLFIDSKGFGSLKKKARGAWAYSINPKNVFNIANPVDINNKLRIMEGAIERGEPLLLDRRNSKEVFGMVYDFLTKKGYEISTGPSLATFSRHYIPFEAKAGDNIEIDPSKIKDYKTIAEKEKVDFKKVIEHMEAVSEDLPSPKEIHNARKHLGVKRKKLRNTDVLVPKNEKKSFDNLLNLKPITEPVPSLKFDFDDFLSEIGKMSFTYEIPKGVVVDDEAYKEITRMGYIFDKSEKYLVFQGTEAKLNELVASLNRKNKFSESPVEGLLLKGSSTTKLNGEDYLSDIVRINLTDAYLSHNSGIDPVTRIQYLSHDLEKISLTREQFDDLLLKGYRVYNVKQKRFEKVNISDDVKNKIINDSENSFNSCDLI